MQASRTKDELGQYDWVVPGHNDGRLEVVLEVVLAVRHTHGCPRKNVGRPHETRIRHLHGNEDTSSIIGENAHVTRTSAANCFAASRLESSFHRGWSTPMESHMRLNL